MGIQLNWEFDEDSAPTRVAPGMSPRTRRRRVFIGLVALGLTLAGLGFGLWERAQAGWEAIDRQVRSAVELETTGLERSDTGMVLSVQDPGNPTWLRWQAERTGGDPAGIGFTIHPSGPPDIGPLSWRDGHPVVQVTTWYESPRSDGTRQRWGLRTEQAYTQRGDRWLRLPPDVFNQPGGMALRAGKLLLEYTRADAPLVGRLAGQLGQLADATCAALHCPPTRPFVVIFAPALAAPDLFASPDSLPPYQFVVPSPALLGEPVDATAEAQLARWYMARLAAGWERMLAQDMSPEQEASFSQAVAAALNRAGLPSPDPNQNGSGPDPALFLVAQPEAGQSWSDFAHAHPATGQAVPDRPLAMVCPTGIYVGRPGDTLSQLADEPPAVPSVLWSPDGSRLAYVLAGPPYNRMEIISWPSLQRTPRTGPGDLGELQSWSPDGRWLVEAGIPFINAISPVSNWLQNTHDGSVRTILPSIYPTSVAWSDSGRYLAYVRLDSDTQGPMVWVSSASNPVVVAWPAGAGFAPAWASLKGEPGPVLTFVSSGYKDKTARATWVVRIGAYSPTEGLSNISVNASLPIGTQSQLALPDLWQLAWSPDGQHLAILMPHGNTAPGLQRIFVVSLADRQAHMLVERAVVDRVDWSPDGRYLIYQDSHSSVRMLVLIDLQTGRQTMLRGEGWDWSPDGRWLATTRADIGAYITTPDLGSIHFLGQSGCARPRWQPGGGTP